MKTTFVTLALAAVHLAAFGQGKVIFGNDVNHLLTVINDSALLTASAKNAALAGLAAPQIGTPSDVMSYLTAQLWAGSSAGSLTLQSTMNPAGLAGLADGRLAHTFVTLTGIGGGQTGFFQILIFETAAGSYGNAREWGGWWSASTPIFSGTAGGFAPTPLTSFSSWTPGPITLTTGLALAYYFGGFWAQPTNQAVIAGNPAAFYVGASAYPSPYYQWYFNSAPIPGATNSSYQITGAQLTHAGSYHVVLSHPYWGVHSSANATLTVISRPVITSPPQSQTAELGATAEFQVSATGTAPLAYQWLFNGTDVLKGATDQVLRLTNVQSGQAGAYVVVVTNLVGSVTSAPALLSVIPPVERRWVPGLILLGQPGTVFNLDATDTLVPAPNWAAFDRVLLTNPSQWHFDLSEPLPAQRFFRAWQAGATRVPALAAHLIPALSLTGPMGSKLQVDGISQFGPTDAWFPLATVTLTNAPQLYFDVSVIGQPPRLWRLVATP